MQFGSLLPALQKQHQSSAVDKPFDMAIWKYVSKSGKGFFDKIKQKTQAVLPFICVIVQFPIGFKMP